MSWDHGYYSHASYTSSYFREIAPNWLDFAALMTGVAPGRPCEGAPFRYLDLGCGTGFGLCLLAALYPEGSFVGVDFLPLHVARAETLAHRLGLKNVRFLEADFMSLAQDCTCLSPDGTRSPRFDYVVSHGVATWVVEPVQRALLATAAATLRPGGLFYCSYNCFPGWLGRTALHQLVRLEQSRNDPADSLLPIRNAASTMEAVLGDAENPTYLGQFYPRIREEVQKLGQYNPLYLSQEYANEGWQPLYVNELHERCNQHKLSYAGTATFTETFRKFLPDTVKQAIANERSTIVRELMVDLATYKAFRRDLFCRGVVSLSRADQQERLRAIHVGLQEAPAIENYTFATSYGNVSGRTEPFQAIESALADGPKSIGTLHQEWPQEFEDLVIQVAFLVHAGRAGLERLDAGRASVDECQRINRLLLQMAEQGAGYEWVVLPRMGQAVSAQLREQLMMSGLAQGISGESLASFMQNRLSSLGLEIARDPEGKPEADEKKQLDFLKKAAEEFERDRWQRLRNLEIVSG